MKQVICPCDSKLVSIMPCKDQSEAMASRAILQGLKVNSPVIELSESFFMLFYFQVIFFNECKIRGKNTGMPYRQVFCQIQKREAWRECCISVTSSLELMVQFGLGLFKAKKKM